jgi:hypothetical protein
VRIAEHLVHVGQGAVDPVVERVVEEGAPLVAQQEVVGELGGGDAGAPGHGADAVVGRRFVVRRLAQLEHPVEVGEETPLVARHLGDDRRPQ